MMVTFVSQYEKKALNKTRTVLDAFANRIGNRTWQTVITIEGNRFSTRAESHMFRAWGADVTREGRVARLIGALDEQTRLARVLIIVDDPLGRENDAPPLILDSLLSTEIECKPMENVVQLEREFIRSDDTVKWSFFGTVPGQSDFNGHSLSYPLKFKTEAYRGSIRAFRPY